MVVGYLLVGVLLGRSALNVISAETAGKLELITDFGLGIVAFMIGTELSRRLIRRLGAKLIIIMVSESLMAFIVVAVLVWGLSGWLLPVAGGALAVALIFGAMAPAKRHDVPIRRSGTVPGDRRGPAGGVGSGCGFAAAASASAWRSQRRVDIHGGGHPADHGAGKDSWFVADLGQPCCRICPGEHFCPRYRTRLPVAGAHLDLHLLATLSLLGPVYIVGRALGLIGGAYIGASLSGTDRMTRRYLGLGILSQAGVAVGLALTVANEFSLPEYGQLGRQLAELTINTIAATTIIFEIVGPITTKIALSKAGEIGRAGKARGEAS